MHFFSDSVAEEVIPEFEKEVEVVTTINNNKISNQQSLLIPQTACKFRKTINMKPTNFVLNEHTMTLFRKKIKSLQNRKKKLIKKNSRTNLKKSNPVTNREFNYIAEKPKLPVDPRKSGEIVRVEKAEIDVDFDVDVEEYTDSSSTHIICDNKTENENLRFADDCKVLTDFDIPSYELILGTSDLSFIEKTMHPEFFNDSRSTSKSSERYFKIRNNIIMKWRSCKPNYLTKTSARSGLKKCGDVNTIGRIHATLEQIGAINFNCCEVNWIRPLEKLHESFQIKQRLIKKGTQPSVENFTIEHDVNLKNNGIKSRKQLS